MKKNIFVKILEGATTWDSQKVLVRDRFTYTEIKTLHATDAMPGLTMGQFQTVFGKKPENPHYK